jgi:predicted GNAT superfamily acetyltransferase
MSRGFAIRPLTSAEDMIQVEALQRIAWPGSETDVVPGHLILALAHNGGLILGAFDENQLVGFVFGFLGTDAESPDRPAMARLKHYSHLLAVHPDYRDRGIGFQLKCAQREMVDKQAVRLITWTYDPLQSRNAYLNICRLGAICRNYQREAYGEMRDGLNIGYPSDRFQVEWWITSSRARSRIAEQRRPLDLANFLDAGAVKINSARLGEKDFPVPAEHPMPMEATLLLIEIPSDISKLKSLEPELAIAWRLHTRELFEEAFSKGYIVTDFVYLKEERFPRSYYLLSYGEGTFG